jgi:transcriptional regulator with XRE-family HTH domain
MEVDMPRPNRPRSVLAEDHLAQRIAAERDARGWTNDGLAKRMTDAGCPMTGSAIFKIEKGEPRRRIVVDELVAFATVFGVPAEELLLPPGVAASKAVAGLVLEWDAKRSAAVAAMDDEADAWGRLRDYATSHPEEAGTLEKAVEAWVEYYYDEATQEKVLEETMFRLSGDLERWKSWVQRTGGDD